MTERDDSGSCHKSEFRIPIFQAYHLIDEFGRFMKLSRLLLLCIEMCLQWRKLSLPI